MRVTRHRRAAGVIYGALLPFLLVREAQAYLDPGTISFVFQSIVAALVGAAIYFRLSLQKVKAQIIAFLAARKASHGD